MPLIMELEGLASILPSNTLVSSPLDIQRSILFSLLSGWWNLYELTNVKGKKIMTHVCLS